MKKVVFFLFLLIILPCYAKAEEYKVLNHYIDSQLEISGSLHVKELIVVENSPSIFNRKVNYFSFGDSLWDGKEVNLDNGEIYNGVEVITLNVTAFDAPEEVDFNNLKEGFTKDFSALNIEDPKDNTYLGTDNKDGTYNYKIYYTGKTNKTAYYIEYSITNVTVKHNDIKELNYTFKNLNYNADNTLLRVLLPDPTNNEKYKVFVHGNKSGKLEELVMENGNKIGIAASFDEIEEAVNVRMLIPDELITIDIFLNKSNIDAIAEVEQIEALKLEKTNQSYKIVDIMKWVLIGLSIIYLLVLYFVIKINNKTIDIIYLLFSLFIVLFNFLFKYNLWYLYIIILIPILGKILRKYIVK